MTASNGDLEARRHCCPGSSRGGQQPGGPPRRLIDPAALHPRQDGEARPRVSTAGPRCRQDLQEWAKPAAALSRQPAAPGEPAAGSPKLRSYSGKLESTTFDCDVDSTSKTKVGLWIDLEPSFTSV